MKSPNSKTPSTGVKPSPLKEKPICKRLDWLWIGGDLSLRRRRILISIVLFGGNTVT